MIQNCNDNADQLVNLLKEQNYSQEIIDNASELSQSIADFDKENPEDAETVRVAKDNYPSTDDAENVNEAVPADDSEETPEDTRDMSLADHKKALKKRSIVITME